MFHFRFLIAPLLLLLLPLLFSTTEAASSSSRSSRKKANLESLDYVVYPRRSEDEAAEKIKQNIEKSNPGITDLGVTYNDGVVELIGMREILHQFAQGPIQPFDPTDFRTWR